MKKFIGAALAAALILPASTYARDTSQYDRGSEQSHSSHDQRQDRDQPSRSASNNRAEPAKSHSDSSWRQFSKGQKFNRAKAPNYRRISYKEHRQLSAPPRGYVWVRSNHDALLVRLSDNIIRQVVTGLY